jgi:hypothetical protein
MDMSAAVLHLRSLGQLTADTQRPYAALARTVERLRIVPAMTIDGVPYFDASAVERITATVTAPNPAHVPSRGVPSHQAANNATRALGAPRSQPRASRPPSGKAARQNVRQPQGAQ